MDWADRKVIEAADVLEFFGDEVVRQFQDVERQQEFQNVYKSLVIFAETKDDESWKYCTSTE